MDAQTLKLSFDQLADQFEALAAIPAPPAAAIGVDDADAARYVRALEFGSVAGERPWPRPGPRTTLAVNPQTGEQVVVSAQAPQGFIRPSLTQFIEAMVREIVRPVNWLNAGEIEAHLADALRRSAESALATLKQSAPRDSGRLADSLRVVGP
jgi:hypothetical protein